MKSKVDVFLNIMSVLATIATLFIALFTYFIAEKTYKLSSDDFGSRMEVSKEDNIIKVKNKDADLFKTKQIFIYGIDNYIYKSGKVSASVNLGVFISTFTSENNTLFDLDDCKINTKQLYMGGVTSSDEASNLYNSFESRIESKINSLNNENESFQKRSRKYYISIYYYNKETFRTRELYLVCDELEDGSFRTPYPIESPEYPNINSELNVVNYAATDDQLFDRNWKNVVNKIYETIEQNKNSTYVTVNAV